MLKVLNNNCAHYNWANRLINYASKLSRLLSAVFTARPPRGQIKISRVRMANLQHAGTLSRNKCVVYSAPETDVDMFNCSIRGNHNMNTELTFFLDSTQLGRGSVDRDTPQDPIIKLHIRKTFGHFSIWVDMDTTLLIPSWWTDFQISI